MTAVEFLFKNMTLYVAYENADTFNKLFEIAKEMEKEQHEQTFEAGYGVLYTSFEQFYSETYKKNNQ